MQISDIVPFRVNPSPKGIPKKPGTGVQSSWTNGATLRFAMVAISVVAIIRTTDSTDDTEHKSVKIGDIRPPRGSSQAGRTVLRCAPRWLQSLSHRRRRLPFGTPFPLHPAGTLWGLCSRRAGEWRS